jgi:hypothetical protein
MKKTATESEDSIRVCTKEKKICLNEAQAVHLSWKRQRVAVYVKPRLIFLALPAMLGKDCGSTSKRKQALGVCNYFMPPIPETGIRGMASRGGLDRFT